MATNARWATRRALVEALKADDALSGIAIDRGWLGEKMEREAIWFGATTTGTLTVPVFTGDDFDANPVNHNDDFRISVHIQAGAAGQTLDEAEDRLEVLYLAVERVVRTDPKLKKALVKVPGLLHILLGELTGPESFATQEGMASFADVILACHTRISGGAE